MVNNISSANTYNPKQYANATSFGNKALSKDVENVVKYATGTEIIAAPEAGPFEGMGLMLAISGGTSAFAGGSWLWNNKNDLKGGWAKYKTETLAETAKLKAAGGITSKGGLKYIFNKQSAKTIMEGIPTGDKFAKLDAATQSLYTKATNAAEFAKANPSNAKRAFMVANKRLAQANAMAHGQVAPTGFFGKVGGFLGKYTGISKLNGALKNLATKSPVTANILKYGKGNGIFLAITAGVEVFTQIIPSFAQLGFTKGIKQIGKSIAKTAASIGGWIVGSAAGSYGGAALGAAIGTVGGPVGTVIGGVVGGLCGFLGGCVGAWAAGKAANKVVGKNELYIAKEEKAKELTDQVQNDPNAMNEVISTAAQRLEAEGKETDDAKIAFGSLSKLKQAAEEKAQEDKANTQTTAQTTAQQSAPSFQGQYNQYASNPFSQDTNDKDFMAMSAGLA